MRGRGGSGGNGAAAAAPGPLRRLLGRGPSCQAPPPPPDSLQLLPPSLLPSLLPLLLRLLLPAPSIIPILETRGWLCKEEEATKEAEEVEAEAKEEEDAATTVVPPFGFSVSLAPQRAAIPKSASFTTPEALTRTFAALTSRWTTPYSTRFQKGGAGTEGNGGGNEGEKKGGQLFFSVARSLSFCSLLLLSFALPSPRSLSHLRVQVSEPRQDLAHNRRGQRLRQRAVPSPRRQGALQRARGAVFQDEREVAARGKGRRAADDVPVAERRQQPDLAGKGRGGSGCREREALDSDDGAREGVDGAEDLVLVERRRRGKERKRGKEGRKNRESQPFSVVGGREGGRGKAFQRTQFNSHRIFPLIPFTLSSAKRLFCVS